MEQVSFLEMLKLELGGVDLKGFEDLPFEIKPGDHVVGIATEEHKRLYAIWQNYERAGMEAVLQARYALNPEERVQATNYAKARSYKAAVIRELFWVSLREVFGIWDKEIGIRSGWRVVWSEPKLGSSLFDLLRGISGPED